MAPGEDVTRAAPVEAPAVRQPSAAADYAETYVARLAGLGPLVSGAPGLHGVRIADDPSSVRLLVTDDRALDAVVALVPTVRTGRIAVFAQAVDCTRVVTDQLGWTSAVSTSMARRDLGALPETTLPSGLALRTVRDRPGGSHDGVTLEQAVAVAVRADPQGVGSPGVLAQGLRSSMPAFRFFAAVDREGVARGTSGVGVFGSRAVVILVNTDPGWRRRGLGRAMTAAALADARARGASHACLDASSSGLSIYRRLGFDVIAQNRRFSSTE